MSNRQLRVLVNDCEIGLLHEEAGLWGFRYADAWLGNPSRYALSPQLPLGPGLITDGASRRPVQWYFDNLLPEEGQRVLLATEAQVDAADAFALLAHFGRESAGSLTLVAPGEPLPDALTLSPLPDDVLSARIRRMPKVPLVQGAPKRMSLAGAQHKLAVVLNENGLFEPVDAQVSTHILKPDHPDDDYPHSAINEWFVMRLAARMGLDVPEVHRRYVPQAVYIVDRFDRYRDGNEWRRRHVIDACQMLGLDRNWKYAQGSIGALSALASSCRSPAVARTRLYRWLVFNVLTGNSDAHLKNLSFLVSANGIQLAPHYDLLSVACYDSHAFDHSGWPDTRLAWPLGEAQRFSQMDRDALLLAGRDMKIAAPTAARLLDEIIGRIIREAERLYEETLAENNDMVKRRPELAPMLAGEARCMRAIMHTVIGEMVRQTLARPRGC